MKRTQNYTKVDEHVHMCYGYFVSVAMSFLWYFAIVPSLWYFLYDSLFVTCIFIFRCVSDFV